MDNPDRLVETLNIAHGEAYTCSYSSEFSFDSLKGCDSTNTNPGIFRTVFANDKGYICDGIIDGGEFCDPDRKFLFEKDPDSINIEENYERDGNTYTLTITQEDFENAFELPE